MLACPQFWQWLPWASPGARRHPCVSGARCLPRGGFSATIQQVWRKEPWLGTVVAYQQLWFSLIYHHKYRRQRSWWDGLGFVLTWGRSVNIRKEKKGYVEMITCLMTPHSFRTTPQKPTQGMSKTSCKGFYPILIRASPASHAIGCASSLHPASQTEPENYDVKVINLNLPLDRSSEGIQLLSDRPHCTWEAHRDNLFVIWFFYSVSSVTISISVLSYQINARQPEAKLKVRYYFRYNTLQW